MRLPTCAPRPGATASTLIEHFPTNSSRNWEADDGARFRIATPRAVSDQKIDFFRGYTCANDVTARDLQKSDGQWTRGKGFDTFCPIGPFVSDEVRPEALDLETRVNHQVRQKGNTRDFIFSLPSIIRYISSVMTLFPGDLILTGTPAGVGPLKEDDRVEVSISGLGTLTNFVVAEDRWASSELEKMFSQPQEFRGQ